MSSYCINPFCDHRQNPKDVENCLSCGTSLLINDRIRLVKPLKPLTEDPFSYTEVFEVDDAGTQWNPVRKKRIMKVLKWNTPKLVELIKRESLALQLIQHPYIPESTLDDFFTFIPNKSRLTLHCLIMDEFEGQNLEQWIESNRQISQSLALDWLKQLVQILDEVHRSEFFHRDIKPSNIVLQPNGQLALIDFGAARQVTNTYLAKVSGSGGTSTGRGGRYEITAISTPRYSPLEQVNGQAVPQSDFYALGRTFVHLATATQLIDLPTDKKTGNLIWRDKAPQIDKPFADFLDELMAPLPGQRPQTTRVILQRLEKLPQQIKNYRLANSKIFKFSKYTLMGLIFVGSVFLSIPLVANYLVIQGEKLEAANDSQRAQEFFDSAIKTNPQAKISVSKFYFDKAARINDNLLSRKYYELAIKYNPDDVDSYNNLAVICQQMRDISCVTKSYNKLFKLQPNIWQGHYNLGNFYDEQNQYDLAEQQYRLAIKYSNNKAMNAVSNLARLKNLQGQYSEAATLALEGLKHTSSSYPQWLAALYKNLGWARLMQHNYKEAEQYLQKSSELDPERVDVYCLLAQTKEALGELNYASTYWEICLLARADVAALPEIQRWRQQVLERLFPKN